MIGKQQGLYPCLPRAVRLSPLGSDGTTSEPLLSSSLDPTKPAPDLKEVRDLPPKTCWVPAYEAARQGFNVGVIQLGSPAIPSQPLPALLQARIDTLAKFQTSCVAVCQRLLEGFAIALDVRLPLSLYPSLKQSISRTPSLRSSIQHSSPRNTAPQTRPRTTLSCASSTTPPFLPARTFCPIAQAPTAITAGESKQSGVGYKPGRDADCTLWLPQSHFALSAERGRRGAPDPAVGGTDRLGELEGRRCGGGSDADDIGRSARNVCVGL